MILTVNAGSSSVRLAAFDAGQPILRVRREGACDAAEELRNFARVAPVEAVAHRFVHGGPDLTEPCIVDGEVERGIERLTPLAPLHQPAALAWLRVARSSFPSAPQVAVFDTAFFAALPAASATYALPRSIRDLGARRYGFHGLAHRAMWERWSATRDGPGTLRAVTLQLGAGCSAAAIRDGRPVDTSMGFTPLEGLVMATRSGDVDPGLLLHLQRAHGLDVAALERALQRESGLVGLSGISGDLRDLLGSDDPSARLAVDVYCHRARKYVGAYLAVLEGADAILVGGGSGENAPALRARLLGGLEWFGVLLDEAANRAAVGRLARIDTGGRVEVWVVPVDEEAQLARAARDLIERRGA